MNRSVSMSPIAATQSSTWESSLLHHALKKKAATANLRSYYFWGSVNVGALGCVATLLYSASVENGLYWWLLFISTIICTLNVLAYTYHFFGDLFMSPVPVYGKQQQLLSLSNYECTPKPSREVNTAVQTPARNASFSELLQKSLLTPPDKSTTMIDTSALSWASYGGGNTSVNNTLMDTSALSWASQGSLSPTSNTSGGGGWMTSGGLGTSIGPMSPAASPMSPNSSLTSPNSSIASSSWAFIPFLSSPRTSNNINNREQLDSYIAAYEKRRANTSSVAEHCSGPVGVSGVWCSPVQHLSGNDSNTTAALRRNVYQQATPDPVTSSTTPDSSKDSSTSKGGSSRSGSIWARRKVTPRQLFQYEENLRIWLCAVVLEPLVKAIDNVNSTLAAIAPDLQIGVVGVEKLRKACSSQLAGVSQLSGLVPFLERAPTQQVYLVQRLRQLAKCKALSGYKWDKGGPGWTDQCPSDALLLVELFGLYLDSQLPPDPSDLEGRVFSSKYIVTTPEKPPQSPTHAILHVTQLSPPHVRVILPDEGECELVEGPKNVLHGLLLFLHHLVYTEHSFIAGVNLSISGINLEWVVSEYKNNAN